MTQTQTQTQMHARITRLRDVDTYNLEVIDEQVC